MPRLAVRSQPVWLLRTLTAALARMLTSIANSEEDGMAPFSAGCVFESKPGSDWTAAKLKEKQDLEKKPWATQDVTEIMKPAGTIAHFA